MFGPLPINGSPIEGKTDMIRAHRRRRETPFWKQDVLVIFAVALYLALALGVVQIWSILSHQGDAFAGSVLRINDDKK